MKTHHRDTENSQRHTEIFSVNRCVNSVSLWLIFIGQISLQDLQSIKTDKIPVALNRTPARIGMPVKH